MLLPARSLPAVLSAQLLAAAGGTLLLPAVAALTLGIVGKDGFPRQQGRNQAFNHVGILVAAGGISLGTGTFGPAIAFWVLGGMAVLAIAATLTTPAGAWNRRRAVGWKEDSEDEPERSGIRQVLGNRRLLVLTVALTLFNLGNGGMLSLLGQKLVATAADATTWTARYVMVAQLVMVPVALFAGSLADKRGRRQLLMVAFAVLPVRAVLSGLIDDPIWLIAAEILDGVASGIVGVAVPVVVADLTWGSGRTQTALGSVNAVQGVGGALSGWYGGLSYGLFGWTGAFLALGVPALDRPGPGDLARRHARAGPAPQAAGAARGGDPGRVGAPRPADERSVRRGILARTVKGTPRMPMPRCPVSLRRVGGPNGPRASVRMTCDPKREKPGHGPGSVRRLRRIDQPICGLPVAAGNRSARARRSFSRARFSIWRTRSFEMPRRCPSASRVA